MAGYTRIYCLGGTGGFMGSDGINPIVAQIWQGDSDRRWFEARYFEGGLRPMGNVRVLIPEGPKHPDQLLDCCLAFLPGIFGRTGGFGLVEGLLGSSDFIDLSQAQRHFMNAWGRLRSEQRLAFRGIPLYEADLRKCAHPTT